MVDHKGQPKKELLTFESENVICPLLLCHCSVGSRISTFGAGLSMATPPPLASLFPPPDARPQMVEGDRPTEMDITQTEAYEPPSGKDATSTHTSPILRDPSTSATQTPTPTQRTNRNVTFQTNGADGTNIAATLADASARSLPPSSILKSRSSFDSDLPPPPQLPLAVADQTVVLTPTAPITIQTEAEEEELIEHRERDSHISPHCSASCPSSPSSAAAAAAASAATSSTSLEVIIAQYQPVYPTWKLMRTQLQQWSLWDRLFTHCTGRDLLCKIVQHAAGLLRVFIYWWDNYLRRFAQHAAFRRMFFNGRDIKELGFLTSAVRAVTGRTAVEHTVESDVTTASTAVVAAAPAESAAESTPPAAAAAAVDEIDEWVPPGSIETPSSVTHCLNYITHTMTRSRQVLRLGRWLYDIPDVKDSILELWYGTSEEKSAEEQEAEEEWEEHERVKVVRNSTRRASIEFPKSPFMQQLANNANVTAPRGKFVFPIGSAARVPTSSAATAAANLLHSQNKSLSTANSAYRLPRSNSLPQIAPHDQDDGDSSHQHHNSHSHALQPFSSSSSSSSSGALDSSDFALLDTSSSIDNYNDVVRKSSSDDKDDADDDEEDDSMTVLEWTVGLIDLANSLMGLVIDASDDIEFISELGFISQPIGEKAGFISASLWLVSGFIDVGMCCYKLHTYRDEMREGLVERLEEIAEEDAKRARDNNNMMRCRRGTECRRLQHQHSNTHPHTHSHDSPFMPRQSSAPSHVGQSAVMPLTPLLAVRRRLVPASTSPTTLCTAECDVDCFHIEYLRFYRYLGELGLSVCGFVVDDPNHPLQLLYEASGLFSGFATFVKRAATHARSKKFVRITELEEKKEQQEEEEDMQLYS